MRVHFNGSPSLPYLRDIPGAYTCSHLRQLSETATHRISQPSAPRVRPRPALSLLESIPDSRTRPLPPPQHTMAATRASSIRALRQLAISQRRSLHMTGPAEFPSPLLTSETPTATKVKRDIEAAQRQADLAHLNTPQPARHFNTSRSLKAVGDSSTIDFAYLPESDEDTSVGPSVRIPLLPSSIYNSPASYSVEAVEPVSHFLGIWKYGRN